MKIILAGGSGFIGEYLRIRFTEEGNDVHVLTRNPSKENEVLWDGKTLGPWTKVLEDAYVLINLTGKSVDCRYTKRNKSIILSSRVDSTKILGEALSKVKNPPKIWINSGTATIYPYSLSTANTEENTNFATGFSVNVARQWEKAFYESYSTNIRKIVLRISIVLGKKGGALKPLLALTKIGLGGRQGKGNQMVSWIHIEDLFRAIKHVILPNGIINEVNLSSPNPVSNRQLMDVLRKSANINFGLPIPAWLLKIGAFIIRTEPELILKSRFVLPQKLKDNGFVFKYPTIEKAVENLME